MDEKLYVFYDMGSCNFGDHECGLEPFNTDAEVQSFVDKLVARSVPDELTITVIKGRIVADNACTPITIHIQET